MSDFTTLGDDEKLKIKVPVKGATNWGDTMKSDTFQKIADHDHSGADGKGSLISKVGSSSQDTTINASTKIALQKPLNLTPQTLPGGYTPAKGDMYIDTAGVLQIYNGTAWLTASQTSTIEGSQDVTFTRDSAHDGKMLKYNHSTTKFEPFVPNLNNLSDMNISGIGDTDILTYNNSTSKYHHITRANLAASIFTHASGDTNFESAAVSAATPPHSLATSDLTTHQTWARDDFKLNVWQGLKFNTNQLYMPAGDNKRYWAEYTWLQRSTNYDQGGTHFDTHGIGNGAGGSYQAPEDGYYLVNYKMNFYWLGVGDSSVSHLGEVRSVFGKADSSYALNSYGLSSSGYFDVDSTDYENSHVHDKISRPGEWYYQQFFGWSGVVQGSFQVYLDEDQYLRSWLMFKNCVGYSSSTHSVMMGTNTSSTDKGIHVNYLQVTKIGKGLRG